MTGWDFETIKEILSHASVRPKFIVTDDREEFLHRMETIAKNGLLHDADNLRCLEILDKVKSVRDGADIFETFTLLKEWNEK